MSRRGELRPESLSFGWLDASSSRKGVLPVALPASAFPSRATRTSAVAIGPERRTPRVASRGVAGVESSLDADTKPGTTAARPSPARALKGPRGAPREPTRGAPPRRGRRPRRARGVFHHPSRVALARGRGPEVRPLAGSRSARADCRRRSLAGRTVLRGRSSAKRLGSLGEARDLDGPSRSRVGAVSAFAVAGPQRPQMVSAMLGSRSTMCRRTEDEDAPSHSDLQCLNIGNRSIFIHRIVHRLATGNGQ